PKAVEPNYLQATFALDLNKAQGLAVAAVLNPLPGLLAERNVPRHAVTLQPCCRVDRVAPQVEEVLAMANYPRHHLPDVDPNAQVPVGGQRLGGRDHLQAAAHAVEHRVLDAVQQSAGGHEGVANGLDLLHLVTQGTVLPGLDQTLEMRDDLFRAVPVAVGREAHDVGEEDRHFVVTPWPDPVGCLQLLDDLVGQDHVQQLVGAALLPLDLFQVAGLAIAEAFLLQAGSDAGSQQHRVERPRQVVIGTHLDAADDTVHLVQGRDHDHRQMAKFRVGLELLQDLQAVGFRHDDVEQDQVEGLGAEQLQGLPAVLGDRDSVA